MDSLCQQRSDVDILGELYRLPQGLHETYARVLCQTKKKLETLQNLARKCLMWVFYAQRPLSMRELEIAVAIEWQPSRAIAPKYNAEAILESCANLLMETDGFVRPIHHSVREFFTRSSQREIDNIYADLILGVDPNKAMFAHPSQIECDYIHKNICFNTDQCEAEIALACISYLTSKDILDIFYEVPSEYQYNLRDKLQANLLLRYCSTHFDQHIQNVQKPIINVLNALDSFLSIETKAFAAIILQIRSVNLDNYQGRLERHPLQVDAMAMIYSTALFTLPHLHKSIWMKQEASKSLLHHAATGGLLDAIEHAVKSGISVNVKDENGVLALYYASKNGHYDICHFFLQSSLDVNAAGGSYGCALQAASVGGHENIVQLLLAEGADINLTGGYYGSALQAASAKGHENILQLLLAKGADVNLTGKRGFALEAASIEGHESIVQLLLAKGADVNLTGEHGFALEAASTEGHESIVQLLLTKGADVNLTGGSYGFALQAASAKGHERIVQLLLAKGADVNLMGALFSCALQVASRTGDENIVQLLLAKGAYVNLTVKRGSSGGVRAMVRS